MLEWVASLKTRGGPDVPQSSTWCGVMFPEYDAVNTQRGRLGDGELLGSGGTGSPIP